MIVITQPNATEEQIQKIVTRVREFGLEEQISRGASRVIIGVIGPEALLREKAIAAMPGGSDRACSKTVQTCGARFTRRFVRAYWRRPTRRKRGRGSYLRTLLG